MSATARSEFPLASVLRRAGAVLSGREETPVALHYGSAAAELAVCVRAVGLVDRSDLRTLVLEAPPTQLSALMTRHVGATVAPGGVISAPGAWWCGVAADRVMVVCDARTAGRLVEALRPQAARHVTVRDRTSELTAIALIGPGTAKVLSALGVYGPSGDPRRATPFTRGSVDGIAAWWMLESDRRSLALVAREEAGEAWLAIERLGRPFGISCVGREAACRYALMERVQPAPPAYL